METLKVVGKSVTRVDSFEKVTGKARFTSDLKTGGMLHARVLRSPHAHARILAIDASRAQRLPGVRAVVTPRDMPAVPIVPSLADQYVFCHGNVARCVGEPVAAVAADDPDIAEEALGLIRVDYEELPAVFDGEAAFRSNPQVIVHPDLFDYKIMGRMAIHLDAARPNVCQTYKLRAGDVERGFREADVIIENRFTTARMQHCAMEPHVATAWFEPDGGLTVTTSAQMIYELKGVLGKLFDLSASKVRLISNYIGGGFGSKGGTRAEPIAALLAQKTGRPVHLSFTSEEMFVFGSQRAPFIVDIRDGVKKDGTLIARDIRVILEIGAYSEKAVSITRRAAAGATGLYRIPNFRCDAYGVYTNLPLTGPLRGFGSPEVEWAVEQQMDIIAHELGMDPVEVRRKNILEEGERNPNGMVTRSIGVRECLDKMVEWISWNEKPGKDTGPWQRGKSVTIGCKPSTGGSTSVVMVKIWPDSAIEIRHSGTEIGQGIRTTLTQIAAEEFGVAIDRVKVAALDTQYCAYDFGTVASRSLIHLGNALIAACRDAKQQLFKMAAPRLGAWDLETEDGRVYVKEAPGKAMKISDLFTPFGVPLEGGELIGRGAYTGPGAPEDPETGQSERSCFDYSYAASAVEVAVNTETGEVQVLRKGMACDVGKAINPRIVEGQIEGGDAMGLGSALWEEVVFNEKGAVANRGFRDYHIPTSLDVPTLANGKAVIVETPEPDGPFGAKGVGELPTVTTAPAIANAVFNAVGVRIKDMPLTKEKVLEAIRKRRPAP